VVQVIAPLQKGSDGKYCFPYKSVIDVMGSEAYEQLTKLRKSQGVYSQASIEQLWGITWAGAKGEKATIYVDNSKVKKLSNYVQSSRLKCDLKESNQKQCKLNYSARHMYRKYQDVLDAEGRSLNDYERLLTEFWGNKEWSEEVRKQSFSRLIEKLVILTGSTSKEVDNVTDKAIVSSITKYINYIRSSSNTSRKKICSWCIMF
jgi:hypothetical protein